MAVIVDLSAAVMLVVVMSWGGERGCCGELGGGEAIQQKERGGHWGRGGGVNISPLG